MEPARLDGLFVLGLNHRSAEVNVRQHFALNEESRGNKRREAVEKFGLLGTIFLSTCNRTEFYGRISRDSLDSHQIAQWKEFVFPGLNGTSTPYCFVGRDAVIHLFRVVSGLDSMVLGETEILGQIKDAFEESLNAGACDRVLADLFRQAITVGKKVRSETPIAQGSLSVASTAIKLARKIVGRLEDKTALILGAGETGVLAARHLVAAGVERLVILNRTRERAAALAAELGAEGGGLDEMPSRLEAADVVIACVEAPEPILGASHMRDLSSRTRCFIDISVPRAIDPAVAEHAGAFVLNLDDIAKLVTLSQSERERQVGRADDIIVGEVHKFLAVQTFAGLSPMVQELKSAFDRVVEQVILDEKTPGPESTRLKKVGARLLGVTLESLKMSTRTTHSVDELRDLYRRFIERQMP